MTASDLLAERDRLRQIGSALHELNDDDTVPAAQPEPVNRKPRHRAQRADASVAEQRRAFYGRRTVERCAGVRGAEHR